MARPGLKVHPKFQRLVHLLGAPESHARGYLECLWEAGYESMSPVIGDEVDIELAAKWPGERGQLCRILLECRLIDEVKPGCYAIHDLLENAPDYVKARIRMRKHRKSETELETQQGALRNCSEQKRTQYRSPTQPNPTQPSLSADTADEEGQETKTGRKPRDSKARRRDDLFDAIVEVTSSDPRASGSYIGRICKSLREADPPYTPVEVRSLPGILQARGFSLPLTLGTVAKYIGWSRRAPEPAGGSAGRKAETVEEKADRVRRKRDEDAKAKEEAQKSRGGGSIADRLKAREAER